jgi:hypothetical protein
MPHPTGSARSSSNRSPSPSSPSGAARPSDQQQREQEWQSSEPLRLMCKYNRISQEKYVQSADLYEQLEVFQEVAFELSSASFFPNLVELWVMDQACTVKNLHGLATCQKLRVLNVTQCALPSADGPWRH